MVDFLKKTTVLGSISGMFGGKPDVPDVSPEPLKVDEKQSYRARDQMLKKLAKLRRATLTSQLSDPNIKRKQLGAGT